MTPSEQAVGSGGQAGGGGGGLGGGGCGGAFGGGFGEGKSGGGEGGCEGGGGGVGGSWSGPSQWIHGTPAPLALKRKSPGWFNAKLECRRKESRLGLWLLGSRVVDESCVCIATATGKSRWTTTSASQCSTCTVAALRSADEAHVVPSAQPGGSAGGDGGGDGDGGIGGGGGGLFGGLGGCWAMTNGGGGMMGQ